MFHPQYRFGAQDRPAIRRKSPRFRVLGIGISMVANAAAKSAPL